MPTSAAANGKPVDWIDYRASVSRALRRRDAGETVRTCAGCRTELDVDDVTHSPKCTGEATAPAAETTPSPPAAVRAWAADHDGRPPTQRDTAGNALLPSMSTVRETHGSWANAVEACGFPRPTRGGRHPSVRTDDRAAAVAADVGGWRDRLLAEADRLEQLAAGHRQTVEAIDRMIEQALEVLA